MRWADFELRTKERNSSRSLSFPITQTSLCRELLLYIFLFYYHPQFHNWLMLYCAFINILYVIFFLKLRFLEFMSEAEVRSIRPSGSIPVQEQSSTLVCCSPKFQETFPRCNNGVTMVKGGSCERCQQNIVTVRCGYQLWWPSYQGERTHMEACSYLHFEKHVFIPPREHIPSNPRTPKLTALFLCLIQAAVSFPQIFTKYIKCSILFNLYKHLYVRIKKNCHHLQTSWQSEKFSA